jgi:hypothetical protein
VRFEFTAVAELELDEAVTYYNRQRAGLGDEFVAEIWLALERILAHPRAWHQLEDDVRRCQLNRFPYGLVYTIEGETILVVAVMYLRRNPSYWRDRLKNPQKP